MIFTTIIPNNTEGNFDWSMRFFAPSWGSAEILNLPNEVFQLVSEIPTEEDGVTPKWNEYKNY